MTEEESIANRERKKWAKKAKAVENGCGVHHDKNAKRKEKMADMGPEGVQVPDSTFLSMGEPIILRTPYDTRKDATPAEGCYVGKNRPVTEDDDYTLEKLIQENREIVHWDGM